MFFSIRRFYNGNRRLIWTGIIALVIVIILVQVLNNTIKQKQQSSSDSITTTYDDSINNPVIEGTKVSEEKGILIKNVIDDFFSYCNNGNMENAYNLLSNECKEQVFPTFEKFKSKYEQLFKQKKLYDIQSWITDEKYTYKINIMDDILSTGGINNTSVEEFFTIVESENGEYRLNIDNYIGKQEINKTYESNNIEITVINKQIYMDYEIYKIKVKNNTDKTILVDGFRGNTLYILEENGKQKVSYLNELVPLELMIRSNLYITKEIKFNKAYGSNSKMDKIVFSDIILDYDSYNNMPNKKEYSNSLKIEVDI